MSKTWGNETSVQFTFVLFGEEKVRKEEEGGMVAVARAVDVVAMPTKSPQIFIQNITMK